MNARQRFNACLNFEKPKDRLPTVEWAPWWNKTVERWRNDGLSPDIQNSDLQDYFGLDPMHNLTIYAIGKGAPKPAHHGAPLITDEASYNELRPFLFTDEMITNSVNEAKKLKERHNKGEIIVRIWLDGFFWFPRTIFGIEPHLYAFYDHPDLMHKMNSELAEYNIKAMKAVFEVLKPDMVGFAEDMSYNHGPMLSYDLFREFLLPHYQKVIPFIKDNGIKVLVDSDGEITTMIPWLQEAGIEGAYPLERQAGVDVEKIRRAFPGFLMLGGFDKMVLKHGEAAIRKEFERLLPVMKSGGFIPSMDHQTPPECSIENYRIYLQLFREYSQKAA